MCRIVCVCVCVLVHVCLCVSVCVWLSVGVQGVSLLVLKWWTCDPDFTRSVALGSGSSQGYSGIMNHELSPGEPETCGAIPATCTRRLLSLHSSAHTVSPRDLLSLISSPIDTHRFTNFRTQLLMAYPWLFKVLFLACALSLLSPSLPPPFFLSILSHSLNHL